MNDLQKRKFVYALRFFSGIVVTVATVAAGFWHAPLSLWLPENNSGVKITPVSISNLGKGKAIVDLSDISGYEANHSPIWIEWDWCPSGGLLNWCISANAPELRAFAQVDAISQTMEKVSIQQLGARWLTIFAPSMFDFQISGSLDHIQIGDLRCPSQGLNSGSGLMRVQLIEILGSPLDDHQIVIREGSGFNVSLEGEQSQGSFTVNNGHYAWSLVWKPSDEIAANPLLPASMRSGEEIKITDEAAILC